MSNTLDLSAAAGTPIKLSSLIIHLRPGLFLYQKCQINPRMSFLWQQASPFKVAPNSFFTFKWSINYSFVWGEPGISLTGFF